MVLIRGMRAGKKKWVLEINQETVKTIENVQNPSEVRTTKLFFNCNSTQIPVS